MTAAIVPARDLARLTDVQLLEDYHQDHDVADALRWTIGQTIEALDAAENYHPQSLDAPGGDDDEDRMPLLELLRLNTPHGSAKPASAFSSRSARQAPSGMSAPCALESLEIGPLR
jgi:hypothetical protein